MVRYGEQKQKWNGIRNIWRNEQTNHWQNVISFGWRAEHREIAMNCVYPYVCAQILRFSSHIVVKPYLYLDDFQCFFFLSRSLSNYVIECVTCFVAHLCRTKTMLKTSTGMSFDDIIANRGCYKYLRHPIENEHTHITTFFVLRCVDLSLFLSVSLVGQKNRD